MTKAEAIRLAFRIFGTLMFTALPGAFVIYALTFPGDGYIAGRIAVIALAVFFVVFGLLLVWRPQTFALKK